MKQYSILFLCTGNICRSPTADAILRDRIQKEGLVDRVISDSAGTHGYHIGHAPDIRSQKVAMSKGIEMKDLKARKIDSADLLGFDLILAMDQGHMSYLEGLDRSLDYKRTAELAYFMDYVDTYQGLDVPDPYYGDLKGFEQTYDIIDQGVNTLMQQLLKQSLG